MLRSAIIVALLALVCVAQDTPPQRKNQEVLEVAQMEGPVQVEQAKEEEKAKDKIPIFIYKELVQFKEGIKEFKEVQAFLLSIPYGQSHEFKYKIASNANPSMIIKIYTQEEGDDISAMKDHDSDNYLEVFATTDFKGSYRSVDKAYTRKYVKLGSYSVSDLFVRLENKFERSVIVEISLSGPPARIDKDNVVKNDNFTVITKKLQAIRDEMKEVEEANRYKFKFQWGFLEREEHYEQEMLKLTGVEALVILGTSVVQMCCIKSLFDNNGVV